MIIIAYLSINEIDAYTRSYFVDPTYGNMMENKTGKPWITELNKEKGHE